MCLSQLFYALQFFTLRRTFYAPIYGFPYSHFCILQLVSSDLCFYYVRILGILIFGVLRSAIYVDALMIFLICP